MTTAMMVRARPCGHDHESPGAAPHSLAWLLALVLLATALAPAAAYAQAASSDPSDASHDASPGDGDDAAPERADDDDEAAADDDALREAVIEDGDAVRDAAPAASPSTSRSELPGDEAVPGERPQPGLVDDELPGYDPNAERATAPRPVPDYDGRGEEETSVGEGLLWVPRVIFFPVYLVSEYVIRRPIGYVVTEAERNDWPRLIFDFFTFEDGDIGIIPTAFYEFGFKPSVGFYLWWDDFIADGNDLRLSFAFWGEDWIHLTLRDRVHLPLEGASISARFDVSRRQDAKFYGVGPLSEKDDKARYELTHLEGGLEFQTDIEDYFNVRIGSTVLNEAFDRPDSEDLSIYEAVERGIFDELPAGFDGFTAYRTSVDFWFDTRFGERPTSETGVRVFTHAEHAVSLEDPDALQWIRYGGAVGGFLNLGFYRTLGLKFQTAFADPLLEDDIPFTQLISIGGSDFSSNVVGDRLLGRSAVWATLEYLWPIWVWLDGSVNVSFGNAFGAHLEDFEWDLLRWSVGFGFATVGEPDQTFELTFGFLGDTFREGAGLDEFRFFFGANSAF